LQKIKKNQLLFGGVHMIVVGDLFQLSPVFDGWVFLDLKKEYDALKPNLWKKSKFVIHELTEIMRQKDDQTFAQIMNRLREGNHTPEDMNVLKTRLMPSCDITEPGYPREKPHMFLTREKVRSHNSFLFDNKHNSHHDLDPVKCLDVVLGHYTEVKKRTLLSLSFIKDESQTANLFTYLPLALDLKYEHTINIDTPDGLCNGSSCLLKKVAYLDNSIVPSILWVEFEDVDCGKMCRKKYCRFYDANINPQWTPIFVAKRTFYHGKDSKPIQRSQFPLRPAMGKTVHKSQGDTLNEVVVDMSTYRPVYHSHYVAFSRVRNKSGLFIRDLAEDKIKIDGEVKIEMIRLRTTCQLKLCYTPAYNFPKESLKVSFLNSRSLHKHFEDVKNDQSFQCCDIIAFAETRLYDNELVNYSLAGYRLFLNCQPPTNTTRLNLGLAIYVNDSLIINSINTARFASNEYIILNVEYRDKIVQVVALYRKCRSSKVFFLIISMNCPITLTSILHYYYWGILITR
jgi:hypothetical protein